MEDLLALLVEPLVSDMKKVKIEKIDEQDGTKYIIHIPQDEIAKVIGRGGKMIKSIKSLAKIRAIKEGIYINVEVVEA